MASPNEWRGTLSVVRLGPLDSLGVAAVVIVLAIVGVALAIAVGLAFRAIGVIAPRLAVGVGLAPLLGGLGYARSRRARLLAAATTPSQIVARAAELVVDGNAHAVRLARYQAGTLSLHGWLGVIDVRASHREAHGLVEALAIPDDGVRTVRVRGPIAAIPVVGTTLLAVAPLAMLFAGTVLVGANHLDPHAVPTFAGVLVVSTLVSALTIPRRAVVVTRDGVELRWLRHVHRVPYAALDELTVQGDRLVLRVRGGRVWRFRIAVPLLFTRTFTLEAAQREAREKAEGPAALANAQGIANVFE